MFIRLKDGEHKIRVLTITLNKEGKEAMIIYFDGRHEIIKVKLIDVIGM